MSSCCVFGCQNRRSNCSNLKFYRIPADRADQKNRRRLWLNAIRRKDWTDTIVKNARVCSAHFISGEASVDLDSPDFVPSVFSYGQQRGRPEEKLARLDRKRKRESQTVEQEEVAPGHGDTDHPVTPEEPVEEAEAMVPQDVHTSLCEKYHQLSTEYCNLRSDFYKLREENAKLKEQLQKSHFSFSVVKDKAAYLLFLTGLTSVLFIWLITQIKDSVQMLSARLTLEDHLLVVLMKLRLGLSNRDIAYRFKVCESTVSNILKSWLPAMAHRLKSLIMWPTKRAILKRMPKGFRQHFKRCRCVMDCTEISIERPANLTARAQTWSNYKHTNTVKYLVGITPTGAISFLSKGWGGRVSDKQITQESGFLHLLEPRDEVLAERGCLIREELAAYGATLCVPGSTKGKSQLPDGGVDSSRQLSRVRIHMSYKQMEEFQHSTY